MPLLALVTVIVAAFAGPAGAQTFSQRGFVEGRVVAFPQTTVRDTTRLVVDALLREEVSLRPAPWLRLDAGGDLRAGSHEQVEPEWRIDFGDRRLQRPRASVRRLSATLSGGGFALDAGRQFIRWGRADIIHPTDRFAPRDYLNVIDPELLPVLAARASFQRGSEFVEGIWSPRFTPTRIPLLHQRWSVIPDALPVPRVDAGAELPGGSQVGLRWRHIGQRIETAAMFFDGYNHLPNLQVRPAGGALDVTRVFPAIRMYGGDAAIPTSWLTLKLEAAYVQSPRDDTEEYVLYVIEVERQVGEWLLDVGYAGDVTTREDPMPAFAPDRGMARSFIGRALYTVDPRRTVTLEGALRQNGNGFYGRVEYAQAFGPHLRLTIAGAGIGGDDDDFLGQYGRNTHGTVALRFSF